jgi:hypothetical protein
MAVVYSEPRPAYTGEVNYPVVITLAGTGSIASWTFSAHLYNPDGTAAAGSPTASVTDGPNRKVTATLPGQSAPGLYAWAVRRTDDSSNDVVARGIIEITNPAAG